MLFAWWKGRKNIQEDLKTLTNQIQKLEHTVEIHLKNNETPPIHIEHLTIENPKLESLVFRMDSLDVEEISGSLNLGNNFGVKVNKHHDANKKKAKRKKSPSPSKTETKTFTKTDSGFRLHMNSKNEG